MTTDAPAMSKLSKKRQEPFFEDERRWNEKKLEISKDMLQENRFMKALIKPMSMTIEEQRKKYDALFERYDSLRKEHDSLRKNYTSLHEYFKKIERKKIELHFLCEKLKNENEKYKEENAILHNSLWQKNDT